MDTWRLCFAFLKRWNELTEEKRKLTHETIQPHIDALKDIDVENDKHSLKEWQEQAIQILYYGEKADIQSIEPKALDAFKSLLKYS